MLHIVFRIIAPEKAWQQNILMIPIGGGPPIAPTFQHFKDISNSISLKLLQGGVKGDRVGEVQCERQEQFGESPLYGITDIIHMPIGDELLVHHFLNWQFAQISTPQLP